MNKIFKIIGIMLIALILAIVVTWLTLQVLHNNTLKNSSGPYSAWVSEMKSFNTTEGTIKYYDQGMGPAIVLLHGVPTSSWMYRNIVADLAQKGHRVIAPDMLGFGASDKPSDQDLYDFALQAERIISLLRSLNIDSVTLTVHDMGGLVGWEILSQNPEMIDGLVILDTILYEDGFVNKPSFSMKNPFHRFFLSHHGNTAVGPIIINRTLSLGMRINNLSKEDRVGYWSPVIDSGEYAITHFYTSMQESTSKLSQVREEMSQANIPIVIMWGEDDPFLKSEQAMQVQKELLISDDNVYILQTGHFIMEEAPTEVVEAIGSMK